MLLLLSLLPSLLLPSHCLMVVQESSCRQVQEEECGLCHTVYREQCRLQEVQELWPTKVQVCRNTTRLEEQCEHVEEQEEQEVVRPVCTTVQGEQGSRLSCTLHKSKRRKPRKVARGGGCREKQVRVEKCFTMVKLKPVRREEEQCSFQPSTVCQRTEDEHCR